MLSIIVAALAAFGWSADHRWQLLQVGGSVNRFDRFPERIARLLRYGIKQEKMHKYPGAGLAHQVVFLGFGVLLLRTLLVWGRGFGLLQHNEGHLDRATKGMVTNSKWHEPKCWCGSRWWSAPVRWQLLRLHQRSL